MLQMSSNVRLMSHRLTIFILSEPFQPPSHPNSSQWRKSCNALIWLKAFGKGPCKNASPQLPRRAQICLWSLSTAPRTVAAQPLPAFRGWHRDALSTQVQPSLHTGLTLWTFQVNLLPPREGKYLITAIIKSSGE